MRGDSLNFTNHVMASMVSLKYEISNYLCSNISTLLAFATIAIDTIDIDFMVYH